MKTINISGSTFKVVDSICEIPKGCELWACEPHKGFIFFAYFNKDRHMLESENKFALKCEGSSIIIKAAICGGGHTIESYNKVLNYKNKIYEKKVITQALPFLEKLYNKQK